MTNKGYVKIRLQGLPEDVAAVAGHICESLDVLEQSRDYSNRGSSQFVRRYITARPFTHFPCVSCGQILPDSQLERCERCDGRVCPDCRQDEGQRVFCGRCALTEN